MRWRIGLPNGDLRAWSFDEKSITLTTSKKIVNLALKEKKSDNGYQYIDLSGQSLKYDNSKLIWKWSNGLVDTLYKNNTSEN